jgi:hypothetical protein
MIAPHPGLYHGQLDAAVESLKLQVDRDTVLQARAALLSEALRLRDSIKLHGAGVTVGRCGNDPVSADASGAFSQRIERLIDHCTRYIADLEMAGAQLGDIARSYGYTEGEIETSFGS